MFSGIFLILQGNNPLPKSNIDWSLLLKYILFHNSINGLFAFTLLSVVTSAPPLPFGSVGFGSVGFVMALDCSPSVGVVVVVSVLPCGAS